MSNSFWEIESRLEDLGFRRYEDDEQISLGDMVALPGMVSMPGHCPFSAMIVYGREIDPRTSIVYWHVARVHVTLNSLADYPRDAQPAAQFERLVFEESEIRKKVVCYTSGNSREIDNRRRFPY